MTTYIDSKNMIWPLHDGDLEIMFNGEIPDYIVPLHYENQHGAKLGETYEANRPIYENESWVVKWSIRSKTEEELQIEKELENQLFNR